jgi:F0F1-type ATP synthase assembly protein I
MPSDKKPDKIFSEWVRYGNIGLEMLASVLVGTFGGYALDFLFHTKPWLMIVGFIFGSAAGFISLFRLLKQEQKKEEKEKD